MRKLPEKDAKTSRLFVPMTAGMHSAFGDKVGKRNMAARVRDMIQSDLDAAPKSRKRATAQKG